MSRDTDESIHGGSLRDGQCERWTPPAWCRVVRYAGVVRNELELHE